MIGRTDDGPVRVLTLDTPARRNALSRHLLGQLADLLHADPRGTRATVLCGTDRYFSAGADLNDLHATTDDLAVDAAVTRACQAIRECPHPTIAAIDGYCLGAAVDLASSFDLVVAHHQATFAVPATRLGLLYDPRSLRRMAQRVDVAGLTRLLLSGDQISAEDAHHVGLVDIVTTDAASREAIALGHRIAVNDPSAVEATTQVLRDIRSGTLAPDRWDDRRRQLVTSPARRDALHHARTPN